MQATPHRLWTPDPPPPCPNPATQASRQNQRGGSRSDTEITATAMPHVVLMPVDPLGMACSQPELVPRLATSAVLYVVLMSADPADVIDRPYERGSCSEYVPVCRGRV